MKIANSEVLHEQTKLNTKKSVTLKEWSKGHLPDLKVKLIRKLRINQKKSYKLY